MNVLMARLKAGHEHMETLLDALLEALRLAPGGVPGAQREAARAAAAHYSAEEEYLTLLSEGSPAVADKMRRQHAEAAELAAHFEDALREGRDAEAIAMARRFHAIAQHNIIEEERDVFPLRLAGGEKGTAC
jgi:hypothetical protein